MTLPHLGCSYIYNTRADDLPVVCGVPRGIRVWDGAHVSYPVFLGVLRNTT